jgi:hypothetical protein
MGHTGNFLGSRDQILLRLADAGCVPVLVDARPGARADAAEQAQGKKIVRSKLPRGSSIKRAGWPSRCLSADIVNQDRSSKPWLSFGNPTRRCRHRAVHAGVPAAAHLPAHKASVPSAAEAICLSFGRSFEQTHREDGLSIGLLSTPRDNTLAWQRQKSV